MRMLLLGDTHASVKSIENAFQVAHQSDCDRIFQVGDCGFWPRAANGVKFLMYIGSLIAKTNISFYFLGGNHEDWTSLMKVFLNHPQDDDGFFLYGDIHVAPRTHAWIWDDLGFISMSGAYSIDRAGRTKNYDWFDEELPSFDDLDVLADKVKAMDDNFHPAVMIAHDAPVNLYQHQGKIHAVIRNAEAEFSQLIHHNAVITYNPDLYIHGHWHTYYQYFYETTQCIGLDQASTINNVVNMVVLDTTTRTLEHTGTLYNGSIFELSNER